MREGTLEARLLDVLGRDAVVMGEGVAAYTVDGLQPRAAVQPATVEQVSELLRLAHAERLAVVCWGGGTMMGLGNRPLRYDLALDLRRLDQVVEHEPADLTATVQAGITLASLQERLGRHGQMVGLDPPYPRRATIGGTLATAVAGPRRLSLGHPRDIIIGMRVVLADGRVTRAGGRVVKNVAGYDLCKLYTGSLGTLAVIVEATFKLYPRPRAEAALFFSFEGAEGACRLAREGRRRGLALASATVQRQEGAYLLLARLAGTEQAVERSALELQSLASPLGGETVAGVMDRWEAAMAAPAGPARGLTLRWGLLPARLPQAMERLGDLSPSLLVAFPTVGTLYARWEDIDDAAALMAAEGARRLAREWEATLTVHSCPAALKEGLDVFGEPPSSWRLMRQVKERWDERGVLAPGRFLGRL